MHPRPHALATWHLLPATQLATGVACAWLATFRDYRGALGSAHAAVNSFADSVLDSLKDVTTYGDENPVPPHGDEQVEHHASGESSPSTTGSTLLKTAAASALASLIGFTSIALARRWSQ